MKKSILLACAVLSVSSALAQSPAPNDQQQVKDLLKTIQAQQAQIAQNQADIDTKLAALAETIRLAKIYASRGGR